MAKLSGKQRSTKLISLLAALLASGLIADYLWASSPHFISSTYYSSPDVSVTPRDAILNDKVLSHPAFQFSPPQSSISKVKSKKEETPGGKKKGKISSDGRILSATFSDLPAPELNWEPVAPAPVARLDGAAIQIKNLFYVFAGYGTIDLVHSHVDVYNFTSHKWELSFDMPKEMAHSHLGMVTDGRFIYVVSGQYGPQCRGPTSRNFVLDTKTNQWSDLLSLPLPRYAAATTLWKGRLHVMGGSKENRHTPALEHWSLGIKDGRALEDNWKREIEIPRGGPHRACIVADDKLMVIGGQEGDFMAKPGSPIFKCSRRNEVVFADVFMLDDEMTWKNLPPMPKPDSHIEFAWALVNRSIVVVGGTTEKHPLTKRMILNNEIFRFDLDTHKWSVIGKLPFRVKTTLVGFWDGWLYFTSGQRDGGPDDPAPRKILSEMWRTKLNLTP